MGKPKNGLKNSRQLDPARLTPDDLARLLTAAGGAEISAKAIRLQIEEGAPADAEGRINLVHFAAWLVREVRRRS